MLTAHNTTRSWLLPTDCETTPGKMDAESQAICTIAGQAELWWQHRPGAMRYLSSLAHRHVREFGPVFGAEQRPGRVELPVAQRLCARYTAPKDHAELEDGVVRPGARARVPFGKARFPPHTFVLLVRQVMPACHRRW